MEIAQLLTDGKISLYFGEIDKLEEDEHLNAYIEVLKSTFSAMKPYKGVKICYIAIEIEE